VIVCHCRVVTDRQVADVVRGGAASLSSVCRTTGAGQDCGSCVFSVKRLVCEHGASMPSGPSVPSVSALSRLSEVDVAAS
jgi:bacterioferritin-associated ferredoxin